MMELASGRSGDPKTRVGMSPLRRCLGACQSTAAADALVLHGHGKLCPRAGAAVSKIVCLLSLISSKKYDGLCESLPLLLPFSLFSRSPKPAVHSVANAFSLVVLKTRRGAVFAGAGLPVRLGAAERGQELKTRRVAAPRSARPPLQTRSRALES